ncbi:hypothetical protein [Psychrobacillus sp. L3]|uniref:hypothetical protein n=1 Tax=Psychrobacillus sp. L3 TaxID=3236891 RepID=UPI0036F3A5B0
MKLDDAKCNNDNDSEKDEDVSALDFFTEYILVKYILMIIPIFLSFLLFILLDGSILGLIKITAGYTVVFSMFILMNEKSFLLLKKYINQLIKNYTIVILVISISLIVIYFSDILFMNSMKNSSINFDILLTLSETVINLLYKFLLSVFLLNLTFYINILILTALIKLDIGNRLLRFFTSEKQ